MKNIEIKKDYNIKIAYEITNFITPTFNYVLIKKDYNKYLFSIYYFFIWEGNL